MKPFRSLLARYLRWPSFHAQAAHRKKPRRRLLWLEALEDRALPSVSISITDASAIEGSDTLKLLDRFVALGSGGLAVPKGSCFGPDGNNDGADDLYVTSADSDAILRFDGVTGSFIDTFVASGSGGLDSPIDLAFGSDGLLYVSSRDTGEVLRYDGSGAFVDTVASGLSKPTGLTFGPDGSLYIANREADEVLRYDSSGLRVFVSAGSGGLDTPFKGVFGPDGNFYVSSHDSNQVLRYDGSTGAFIDTFVTTTLGVGPWFLGFGTDGYLYTTEETTSACCDKSIVRYNAATGARVDTLDLNRDGWAFMIGPGNIVYDSGYVPGGSEPSFVERFGPSSIAPFTITLDSASDAVVTIDYSTADGTALVDSDYVAASGTVAFQPGETSRTVLVQSVDDTTIEPTETFTINLSNTVGAIIEDDQGVGTILDNETKFFVINDGTSDQTYDYALSGNAVRSSNVDSGNTAPRGVASNEAGTTVWVVDANKKVYVYDDSGVLLGSWTAAGLSQPEGIAVSGNDGWIVDAFLDRVLYYPGAAGRTAGSQSPINNGSFKLNSSNTNATGIVAAGMTFWVVDDAPTGADKVYQYKLAGTFLSKFTPRFVGSWTIDSANSQPTGITVNPNNVSDIWIVDKGTGKVYQYTNAASRTSGSQTADASFALIDGNTEPQDIADPPGFDSLSLPESIAESSTPSPARPILTEAFARNSDLLALATMPKEWPADQASAGRSVERPADEDRRLRIPRNMSALGRIDLLAIFAQPAGPGHATSALIDAMLAADEPMRPPELDAFFAVR